MHIVDPGPWIKREKQELAAAHEPEIQRLRQAFASASEPAEREALRTELKARRREYRRARWQLAAKHRLPW